MRTKTLAAVVALLALVAVAAPGLAAGAEQTAAPVVPRAESTQSSPTTGGVLLKAPLAKIAALDVQIWPEETNGASTALVVVATLATGTPLPATVRMPLPPGANVTWAGEIFNGGPSADEQRQFKKVTGTGGDAVEIVVQKTRDVQYEADYAPPVQQGDRRKATLQWVQSAPAEAVRFGVKLPAAVDDVKTQPAFTGKPQVNAGGDRLYLLPVGNPAVGGKTTVSVDYLPRAAVTTGTGRGPDLLLPVLIAALVVVLGAIVYVVSRQRRTE